MMGSVRSEARWQVAVLALAAGLIPAVLGAQALTDARPISLDEAVKLAQLNQPSTVLARNALRTTESTIRTTLLGYLPSLSIGQSASQRGGTQLVQGVPLPLTGNPWSYGRSLSFGQVTLFDGMQRWNNYRTQQANLNANETSVVSAQYAVALNVKTAYYAILTAREQEAAAQRQLEQAQQQLRVSTAKMQAGSATRTDSLSGAIAVGTARQAILTAQNQLLNANAQLTRYVATAFTVTALPADSAEVTPIGLSDAELMAVVQQGPAVMQTTAQLAAAQAAQRAAQAPYMPTLTVSGNYGQTMPGSKTFEIGGGTGSKTTSTSLSFNLNYTLFNNYQREAGLVTARVNLENAQANLRDAKFLAQQNLTTQLNTFRTATLSIELNKLQIQSAEENLRVVQQQYNLGTKQLLDMLTAQTSLDNARTSLITARQNARIAKANIESLIGRELK
jgi:outer membrane protein